MKLSVLIFIGLLCLVYTKSIYDTKKSYVTPVTKINVDKQIVKPRQTTKQLILLQFYKYNDGKSAGFAKAFDEFTNEYQGVFKICSVDCDEEAAICKKEKVDKFPTFRFYPPLPVPTIDYEGDLDTKKILAFGAKFMESNVVEITKENIDAFINDSPSVPKVFLFTDKKGVPTIYKGLSVNFEKKIFFGIVRSSDEDLMERFSIKQAPSVIVVKATEKRPQYYKGEMKFNELFKFINVFSEVFVPGGGSSTDSAATKTWLTEIFPEMDEKSANDICLKAEGTLCVILLSKGKPSKEDSTLMKSLHKQYDKKIERGSTFKFMWMDVDQEAKWAALFGVKNYPSVVVLNSGRRKRYVVHEGDLSQNNLETTLERINGGDARFVVIKDELPEFTSKKQQ